MKNKTVKRIEIRKPGDIFSQIKQEMKDDTSTGSI
jgi:hypothetical protein